VASTYCSDRCKWKFHRGRQQRWRPIDQLHQRQTDTHRQRRHIRQQAEHLAHTTHQFVLGLREEDLVEPTRQARWAKGPIAGYTAAALPPSARPAPLSPQPSPPPVTRRKITPWTARPGPEDDPVDHQPMIQPPATPNRNHRGQERPKPPPLLIGQIMTIQRIRHRTYLHEPTQRSTGHAPRDTP
jgi:hypothetical protein